MPRRQRPAGHQVLHVLGQCQQPEAVADRGPRLAQLRRQGVVGQAEVIQQLAVRHGLLDGVEVGAVDVLDERLGEQLGVLGVAHHDGDLGQPSEACRAEAPFAGDDLVAPGGVGARNDRLQHADLAQAVGQLAEERVVEAVTRLARVRTKL